MLLILGVTYSGALSAQEIDTAWWDMDYIRNSDARLSSRNASGLKYLSVSKVSTAKVFLNKSDGSFKNYHQSDDSYDFGATTESLYRLNQKVVLSGGISYHNFSGKNMAGSAFIDPYKNPFDLVEMNDNNKGTKNLERYQLFGEVSSSLTKKLTIGGKIDYQTANFAKTKDLRHINKLLDMHVSPGLSYTIGSKVEIGANYEYHRRIESVRFRVYGNKGEQFFTLISYGGFYGRSELFDMYGYTSENANRPIVNITQGGALQLAIALNKGLKLFNEFTYGKLEGYAGERGTSSVVYTEHGATQYGYKGVLSFNTTSAGHHLTLRADYETLANNENIYRTETSPGGGSTTVYYGQAEVFNKDILQANVQYIGYLNVKNNQPEWTIKAGANYFNREQTTTIYPFYRDQSISSYTINLSANKNTIRGKNRYGLSLGTLYGAGDGTAKEDGLYIPPSSSQIAPKSMDLYLNQEYEYFTKPRVRAEAGFQYSRIVDKRIAPYVRLDYTLTKAFDVSYVGNNHQTIMISVGCNF